MSRSVPHWLEIPGKPDLYTQSQVDSLISDVEAALGLLAADLDINYYTKAEVDSLVGGIDLSGVVPYTGATQNVDLGTHELTAQYVNATYLHLHQGGLGAPMAIELAINSAIGINGALSAQTVGGLNQVPIIAERVYLSSSTGPQLDNSSGTIRARTNNGLADAPFSASQVTASSNLIVSTGTNAGKTDAFVFGGDAYLAQYNGAGSIVNYLRTISAGNLLGATTFSGNVTVQTNGTFPAITNGPINVKSDGIGNCLVLANSATEYTRFVSGGVYKGLLGQGSVPLVLQSSNVKIMADNTIAFRNVADSADAPITASQFNWLQLDTVSLRGRMMHRAAVGVDLQANEATNPLFRVSYAGTEYPLSVARSGVVVNPSTGTHSLDVQASGTGSSIRAYSNMGYDINGTNKVPLKLEGVNNALAGELRIFPSASTAQAWVFANSTGALMELNPGYINFAKDLLINNGTVIKGVAGANLVLRGANGGIVFETGASPTTRLTIDNAGVSTFTGNVTTSGDVTASSTSSRFRLGNSGNVSISTTAGGAMYFDTAFGGGSATYYFRENGSAYFQIAGVNLEVQGTRAYCFAATTANAADIAIYRIDANTLEINNRTAGTRRDLQLRNLNANGAVSVGRLDVASGGGVFGQNVIIGGLNKSVYFGIDTTAGNDKFSILSSGHEQLWSGGWIGWSNLPYSSGAAVLTLSRAADGILQVGTTGANASGSVNLTNLTASGYVTSGFQSLSADPSTIDIPSGGSRLVKNTTSGVLKLWANDGGTMKSVALT